MKLARITLFTLITVFIGNLSKSSAQIDSGEVYKLWALPNQSNQQISPTTTTQEWTGNSTLDALFNQYNVTEYTKAFPNSKDSVLQQVYRIKCQNCSLPSLKDSIEIVLPDYFDKIEEREYQPGKLLGQNTVDPADYMWQAHKNWLWHLTQIEASKAWGITKGDPKVKIGLIDTYFDLNGNTGHPDLLGEFEYKYDPYDNTTFTDCKQANSGNNYHGTHVASLASGETTTNGNKSDGQLASIGYNTKMIGYKVKPPYLQRARHAALEENVQVLTSSYLWSVCPDGLEWRILKEILDEGTTVVMPAGNGDKGTHAECNNVYPNTNYHNAPFPLSPYYDERVIIVSSAGKDDKHFNSNGETHSHFPSVDILAPDYDGFMKASPTICGTDDWPYYGKSDGTSYATPIVAGVAGLMYSVNDNLAPSSVQDILKSSADPIADIENYSSNGVKGMRKNSLVGDGRVNAYKAVKSAKEAHTTKDNDLFLRDVPMDWGETPSVNDDSYDYSPDIWVRRSQEDYRTLARTDYSDYKGHNDRDHQKAAYSKNPNYVYVEVRNRGDEIYKPNTENAKVSLYWSIQSGWASWPDNWTGKEYIEGTNQPVGTEIGTIKIPKLKPGQSKIVEFEWNVPDPNKIKQHAICLLARIKNHSNDQITAYPDRLDKYVKRNNNVGIKNVDIYNLLPGEPNLTGIWDDNMESITYPHGNAVTFENPTSNSTNVDIEISTPGNQASLMNEGEVTLTFNKEEDWNIVKNEMTTAEGIKILEPGQVQVVNDSVRITNVSIPPETRIHAFLDLNMLADQTSSRESYEIDIGQYISSSGTYTGGGHYVINDNGGSMPQVGLPESKEINQGESITISPELQTDNKNYKWYDNDQYFISRGSKLTVNPDSTKNYYLEFISPAGYKDYEEIAIKVNQNFIKSAYPNPASENVTVEYKIENLNTELMLVNNETGNKSIYPIEENSSQTTLDISDKETGTYTLFLKIDDELEDKESLSII